VWPRASVVTGQFLWIRWNLGNLKFSKMKLHHAPALPYCGLTIVLSNPSRFDYNELLSGNSGAWFLEACIKPHKLTRYHLDIRTSNVDAPLLPNTKVVLCLGETAQHEWMGSSHTLCEQRGAPVVRDGITYVSSFFPQDAFDIQNYEARLNKNHRGSVHEDSKAGDDEEAKGHKGATRRGNYKFWLSMDTAKAFRILKQGIRRSGQPDVRVYSSSSELIHVLQSTKKSTLYLDIETLFNRTLTCIGFAFEEPSPVYVFPIRTYNYTAGYESPELCRIMAALGTAMRDNLTVTHNGHAFDWLVLAHHYRVPFGRQCYDTMIAHNRCYPEAEKSLGHALSLWTDEPYHKDEGVFDPRNIEQERQLWNYNAKDVHALRLLKRAFDDECSRDIGLAASIKQGNEMIYPYMMAALKGIKMDDVKLTAIVTENDRYMMQLLRIARILVGDDDFKTLQGKSDVSMLSSNKQAARYFYDVMGYKCPYKTDTGEPACDAGAMFKLKLWLKDRDKENPMIDLRLAFAGVKKENGLLANLQSWPDKSYV